MRRTIPIPGGAVRPFSAAAVHGDTVYVSGQVGVDRGTGQIPEGLEAQTRQTLRNLQAVLESAGSGLDLVLKATVFLVPGTDAAVFNAVYKEFFPTDPPARSLVTVAALAGTCLVEVECIAAIS